MSVVNVTQKTHELWWGGDRETCPACGSDDIGTFGNCFCDKDSRDEFNRTDWDLADLAECNTCGWTSQRDPRDAENERLHEANRRGDELTAEDIRYFRRLREEAGY